MPSKAFLWRALVPCPNPPGVISRSDSGEQSSLFKILVRSGGSALQKVFCLNLTFQSALTVLQLFCIVLL